MKESVWDYPRPPRIEALDRRVRIEHGGQVVAESDRAVRVLETASPPTVYVPAEDVRTDLLTEVPAKHTFCEWKGRASYFDLEAGGSRSEAAISMPSTTTRMRSGTASTRGGRG